MYYSLIKLEWLYYPKWGVQLSKLTKLASSTILCNSIHATVDSNKNVAYFYPNVINTLHVFYPVIRTCILTTCFYCCTQNFILYCCGPGSGNPCHVLSLRLFFNGYNKGNFITYCCRLKRLTKLLNTQTFWDDQLTRWTPTMVGWTIVDNTTLKIWFSVAHTIHHRVAYIGCRAITAWQIMKVSHDIKCYMTSHKTTLINTNFDATLNYIFGVAWRGWEWNP